MTIVVLVGLFVVVAAVLFAAWRVAHRPPQVPGVVLSETELASLDAAGFFRFVPEAELAQVRDEVARTTWSFWVGGTRRFFRADAENLAEGGVAAFISELAPVLEQCGVPRPEVEDVWEKDYRLSVNGREFLIWSAEEAARERDANQPGLVWGVSGARAFAVVNRSLRKAGSDERVYAVSGGNDLLAFLLTPRIARIVSDFESTVEEEKPYIPTEEYPWFGQPHEPRHD